MNKSVAYEHGGVELEGILACDDSKGTGLRPGVLLIPEWWGLNDYVRGRADAIAKLGYVAFAADMYGKIVTTDAKKASELAGQFYGKPIMAERARAGFDQLAAHSLVDRARVAAIGFCFGGTVCQALAYSGAPLAGIVSFHGGLIQVPEGAARRNSAKWLVCHGALDPMVQKDQVDAFLQSADAAKMDYQFNIYAGAVHAFSNPDADALAISNGLKGIAYSPSAARRSWADMKRFLNEIFEAAPTAAR